MARAFDGVKWRTVLLVALAELLVLTLWFSASAVTPTLTRAWNLSAGNAAWLTMAVQIGFVVGAFLSSLFNVADVWPPRYIFATGALIGAVLNAAITLVNGVFIAAVFLRFGTGFALALVYPVGMKIVATWMQKDRGLGLGLLVGALTIGSASPHLLRALGGVGEWRFVLWSASIFALIGGLLVWRTGQLGPFRAAAAPFRWRFIGEILRDRGVRLANFGYLGHMWELYAMWTWIPAFLLASYQQAELSNDVAGRWLLGRPENTSALAAFGVIAIGGLSSLLAGALADRWGRSMVTIGSLLLSGACSLFIGFFFGGNPTVVTLIAMIWGGAIVADSAQYSTAVSELVEHRPSESKASLAHQYMGTALTLQTSMGFLLTLGSIRLIPLLAGWMGWQWVFIVLVLGPIFGIWAMWQLKRSPDAAVLAGGRG